MFLVKFQPEQTVTMSAEDAEMLLYAPVVPIAGLEEVDEKERVSVEGIVTQVGLLKN